MGTRSGALEISFIILRHVANEHMSILPHQNETKTMNLSGTHATCSIYYQILTFIGGTVGHVFCDCYDIMLLTKGEGHICWLLGDEL